MRKEEGSCSFNLGLATILKVVSSSMLDKSKWAVTLDSWGFILTGLCIDSLRAKSMFYSTLRTWLEEGGLTGLLCLLGFSLLSSLELGDTDATFEEF